MLSPLLLAGADQDSTHRPPGKWTGSCPGNPAAPLRARRPLERSGVQGYHAGEGIMFHLVDRRPLHGARPHPMKEWVVTALAADLLRSTAAAGCLIQIQTKFRDEIRPRSG